MKTGVNLQRCCIASKCDRLFPNEYIFINDLDRVEHQLYNDSKIINLLEKLAELRYFQTFRVKKFIRTLVYDEQPPWHFSTLCERGQHKRAECRKKLYRRPQMTGQARDEEDVNI